MQQLLVNKSQIARMCGVHRNTVTKWVSDGALPPVVKGTKQHFLPAVMTALEGRGKVAAPKAK